MAEEQAVDVGDLGADKSRTTPPKDPATGRFVADPAKFPEALIQKAREVGYDDDDMATMSVDGLRVAVKNAERDQAKLREQFALQRTLTDPHPTRQDAPALPAPEEDDLPDFTSDQAEGLLPPIVAMHKALKKERERNKRNEERLAQVEQREKNRADRTAAETLDMAFEDLAEEYGDIFGKGDAAEFKDKAEMKRRNYAIAEAGLDIYNLPPLPRLKAKLKAAAETLHPQAKKKEPKEDVGAYGDETPRVSKKDWDDAALARTTHRKGAPEPNGVAKATRNLEKKLQENDAAGDRAILDTLM